MFENIFETVNSGFAQALYEDYLKDPASVPDEWRALFDRGVVGEAPAPENASESDTGDGSRAPAPEQQAPAEAHTPARNIPENASPIKGPALRLLQNMEASLRLPTATSFREIDVSTFWDTRRALNQELASRDIKLSFTHLIGWAIVQAARQFPSMVQAVIEAGGEPHRLEPAGVHLGLAVDVTRKDGSRGLMVPVVKNTDAMDFKEFHTEYERLVQGARNSKLMPDAYMGGTITLTNPGTIGTTASVPRLMSGQGSIIATGAIRNTAAVRLMTITSTYDHRIIQGAESGDFLRLIDQMLNGEHDFYSAIATSLGLPGVPATATPPAPAPAAAIQRPAATRTPPASDAMLAHVGAAMSLVKAYRMFGHHAARLDPLGTPPRDDPALDTARLSLTPDVLASIPASILRIYVEGETLAEALPHLHDTYCGTIAYEIEHIADHDERVWLRDYIESGKHREPLPPDEKRELLTSLVKTDGLETFLHRAYLGHKRFGIEGLDALVPMLREAINQSADRGTEDVVIGMAHRGRLNVLTHVLGRPYETLLAEFEGGRRVEETLTPRGGTGDVKYHHGATGELETRNGKQVAIHLIPNPSHLEAVDPVVEGRTRAAQSDRSNGLTVNIDHSTVLPVLIHGDAAFAGQGVVAETFNLERLEGYSTGGTLHIITNNQIGFTAEPKESRSTEYASDPAKGFDIPIIHVNADDVEACIAAIRLAITYRERFAGDVVVDLVGYRRHGHNEGDEPRYTQPQMYHIIDKHPTSREIYATKLVESGVITQEDADRLVEQHHQMLVATQEKLQAELAEIEEGEEPQRISGVFEAVREPSTAVEQDALIRLNEELLTIPEGFTPNRKLMRQLERRRKAFGDRPSIDWGHAESLALASLLTEGIPVRLTGQDTERGTFSQRHLVLHDADTGKRYVPMHHLSDGKAAFELHNSPLSEYAALGFEYGYSVAAPETLVLWEAQFGDFANNAEAIIDQFIVAGLAKWGQTARLVLLLPHGYEGQGPEHSSARLERYLALGAQGNIRVANCSTPAQYYHLLRRQAKISEIRPLVLMTPKSLLRLPLAASRLAALAQGSFKKIIDDPTLPGEREEVTKLVLCSGKVFYDIVMAEQRPQARHVAVGRVELLYPFPDHDLKDLVSRYPHLKEITWVQEEPNNMGARKWAVPRLAELVDGRVRVTSVTRPESSSPAEGYPAAHKIEQARIVTQALL